MKRLELLPLKVYPFTLIKFRLFDTIDHLDFFIIISLFSICWNKLKRKTCVCTDEICLMTGEWNQLTVAQNAYHLPETTTSRSQPILAKLSPIVYPV